MKLYYDQLQKHLEHKLEPFYFIYGYPEILTIDAKNKISDKAQLHEFTTQKYYVDTSFNPQDILTSLNTLGLFQTKRLIEIYNFDSKLPANLTDFILNYLDTLPTDVICIIKSCKLSNSNIPKKLQTEMDSEGFIVSIYPLKSWQIENHIKPNKTHTTHNKSC